MIGHLLLVNGLLLLGYMTYSFIVARLRQRIDTVDMAWGIGFILAAWSAAIQYPSTQAWIVAGLITIWGLRLASHIANRSQRGEDPRYTALTKRWSGHIWLRTYVSIFLVQAALIWVISLPVVLLADNQLPPSSWLTYVGATIWLIGFSIEAAADHQLQKFLKTKNHASVFDRGLWHYSRHPNYFGELTQWWGVGVIALQASHGWIGLFGPLTLTLLILFVSGIPPIERRRQHDKAYQTYAKHTSMLVPLPPRQKAS